MEYSSFEDAWGEPSSFPADPVCQLYAKSMADYTSPLLSSQPSLPASSFAPYDKTYGTRTEGALPDTTGCTQQPQPQPQQLYYGDEYAPTTLQSAKNTVMFDDPTAVKGAYADVALYSATGVLLLFALDLFFRFGMAIRGAQ
jgi:hypothetical protein